MDCSSATEQPVRQPCDAFLELGPQSHADASHERPSSAKWWTLKSLRTGSGLRSPVFRFDHPSTQCRHPTCSLNPNHSSEDSPLRALASPQLGLLWYVPYGIAPGEKKRSPVVWSSEPLGSVRVSSNGMWTEHQATQGDYVST